MRAPATGTRRAAALDAVLGDARALVFACSGNVVRSAFAELWARHRGLALSVRSVATTFRNPALFPQTRAALLARGVAPNLLAGFRPTHVDDLEEPWRARLSRPDTLVLAMTPVHVEDLAARGIRARLLEELRGGERAIEDPVLEGASFERTFERVEACVEALIARHGALSRADLTRPTTPG